MNRSCLRRGSLVRHAVRLHDAFRDANRRLVDPTDFGGSQRLDALDRDGRAPLHIAAEAGESITVTCALAATKADVNMRDGVGATPLHLAAGNGSNPGIIDILLASGADPTVRDGAGRLPVELVGRLAPVRTSDACWRLHGARYA